MGSRSKMRKDPAKRSSKRRNFRFSPGGTKTVMSDLEAYWRKLKFKTIVVDEVEHKVSGANKYCIRCTKGNGQSIIECKQHWCSVFDKRYTLEPLVKEKDPEIELETTRG